MSGGCSTDPGRTYLTADMLGSTRLVTDATGAAIKAYDYLPFGEAIQAGTGGRTTAMGFEASPDKLSIKFTGKERDAETGLDFMEARYYSGAQGRFTSPDEPFAGQDSYNPQSWNLYSYGLNNPLLYSDPTGREPCENGVNPENGNICTVVTAPRPVEPVNPGGVITGIGKDLINDFIGFTNLIDWMRQKSFGGPDFRQTLLPANNESERRGMIIGLAATTLFGGGGGKRSIRVIEEAGGAIHLEVSSSRF